MKLSEKIAIAIDGFVLCGGDIDIESLVILIEPHTAQLEAENERLDRQVVEAGTLLIEIRDKIDALINREIKE